MTKAQTKACFVVLSVQAQVSGSTYSTVLKDLQSDTEYTVTVVPVYPAGEGQRLSDNGKTCKHQMHAIIVKGHLLTKFHSEIFRDKEWHVWKTKGLEKLMPTGKETLGMTYCTMSGIFIPHACPEWTDWLLLLACGFRLSRTFNKVVNYDWFV